MYSLLTLQFSIISLRHLIVIFIELQLGYCMIIFLAGLQTIPQSTYDAAKVDGANYWQRLIHLTIPFLKPAFIINIVLNLIWGLKAFDVIFEADKLKRNCNSDNPHIFQEIGDLYLRLHYPKEALKVFNEALKIEEKDENKILITLMIAQCYKALNKEEDYLALYDQIAGLNDPFWKNIAKERLDEINFDNEMMKKKE